MTKAAWIIKFAKVLFLYLASFWATNVLSADDVPNIKVGISIFDPLITKGHSGDTYSGFEIELWEQIAKQNNWSFTYIPMPFKDLLKSLDTSSIDIAMGGISVTSPREKLYDFTYSYLNAGFNILVNGDSNLVSSSTFDAIFNDRVGKALLYLALFILISGHLVWFLDRGHSGFSNAYFPGIFESFWWGFVTMTTVGYGDFAPKNWMSRILAVPVMFSGIIFFAWFIAQMQSALELEVSKVKGPSDLHGLLVGTQENTASEAEILAVSGKLKSFPDIKDAYLELGRKNLDAVVFDASNIRNFVKNDDSGRFRIVGSLFREHGYAISVKQGSERREAINQTLLDLEKTEFIKGLKEKWFVRE